MKTHKLSNTPLHKAWMRMNKRCNNPNYESYHRYGGRGIKVCERWKLFENFYSDMKDTYKPGLSLERKDNDLDYSPGNCKWATIKEQANNRGTNRLILFRSEPFTLMQLSEMFGINRTTIAARLDRGMRIEDALK
jgi:hypothetical protein